MAYNYVLSIGSNVSAANVEEATVWLKGVLDGFCMSHIYETPAVKSGNCDDGEYDMLRPDMAEVKAGYQTGYSLRKYSNAVVTGSSMFHPEALDEILKGYEKKCGRDDAARAEGRVPIDIDVVVCNGKVMRPWDFRQQFFRIGLLELAGSPV